MQVKDAIISHGSIIKDGVEIDHSIIGLRARIDKSAIVKDTLIMGSDYYETESQV